MDQCWRGVISRRAITCTDGRQGIGGAGSASPPRGCLEAEPCKCQFSLLTQAQLLRSLGMGLGLHIQQVGT